MELELIPPPGSEENTNSAPLSFRIKETPLVMCSFCRNYIDHDSHNHLPTVLALKSSAASGCVMCNQFLRSFVGFYYRITESQVAPKKSLWSEYGSDDKYKRVGLSILYVRGDWDAELDKRCDKHAGASMYMEFVIELVRTFCSDTADFNLPELNTFALSELDEDSSMSNTVAGTVAVLMLGRDLFQPD
jgi:hypothetical protein